MIHTQTLNYTYPNSKTTLQFADVRVAQGGTLVLRGPSGSGKSTWLALVAGLMIAQGGDLIVAGQQLNALTQSARDAWRAKYIGFLPQRLHLSEALSVADNLALPYFAAGLPLNATAHLHVATTLDFLGIAELAQRKPSELSGGQAQRVALARAVLLNPKVILADEPTASLDDDNAHAALNLLQATAKRLNATLLIATHDARVMQQLSHSETLLFSKNSDEIGINPTYLLPKVLLNE
ncbi:MAG: ATP-binding cassette domain-containing protein [Rhodoferax sp.]|nr:ATP-binding cassette domain-containing protein [Rhodoferax sp.]